MAQSCLMSFIPRFELCKTRSSRSCPSILHVSISRHVSNGGKICFREGYSFIFFFSYTAECATFNSHIFSSFYHFAFLPYPFFVCIHHQHALISALHYKQRGKLAICVIGCNLNTILIELDNVLAIHVRS